MMCWLGYSNWENLTDKLFRWLERRIGWHLLIDARLDV